MNCPGSLAVIPETQTNGEYVAACPICRKLVLTTGCPETDGRDVWVEIHRPRLALRADRDLAAYDRIARAESVATMSGAVEPW